MTTTNSTNSSTTTQDDGSVKSASQDVLAKKERRRIYNRQCAARCRKRNKDSFSTLQKQVQQLAQEKQDMLALVQDQQVRIQQLESRCQDLLILNATISASSKSPPAFVPSPMQPASLPSPRMLPFLNTMQQDTFIREHEFQRDLEKMRRMRSLSLAAALGQF